MNNELTAAEIDKELHDNKKSSFRTIMDDKIIPAAGMAGQAVLATGAALTNLKDQPKLHTIQ